MTLNDIRDTIGGTAAVWWKCRGFSYFFLLILFHPSLPKKNLLHFFFIISLVSSGTFSSKSHCSGPYVSSFFFSVFFFLKIPHNKNVSLILILLLRQSKPSLLGMSYKSQKSSDSLGQRLYLKHLLCGRSRLNTDQVARGAVRGPEWAMSPSGGPATRSPRPGSGLGPLCLPDAGTPASSRLGWTDLVDVKVTEQFCLVTKNEMATERG